MIQVYLIHYFHFLLTFIFQMQLDYKERGITATSHKRSVVCLCRLVYMLSTLSNFQSNSQHILNFVSIIFYITKLSISSTHLLEISFFNHFVHYQIIYPNSLSQISITILINSNSPRVCRSLINGHIVRVKASTEWGATVGAHTGLVGGRDPGAKVCLGRGSVGVCSVGWGHDLGLTIVLSQTKMSAINTL